MLFRSPFVRAARDPRGANPPGSPNRNEGYLYWAGWLAHNGVTPFAAQDGNGFYRRIYYTASCQNITNLLTGSPAGPVITGLVTGLPALFTPGAPCG